jgi:hypothetical protein
MVTAIHELMFGSLPMIRIEHLLYKSDIVNELLNNHRLGPVI